MKIKSFLVFFRFLLCASGCGDEGIENTLQSLSAPSASVVTITGVPIEVQEMIWINREEYISRLLFNLEQAQHDEELKPVADHLLESICVRDRQSRYYTKYIDAGGIAIMGNSVVMDQVFLDARDIVLKMTAKRPELQEQLSPANRHRQILLAGEYGASTMEIPEHYKRHRITFHSYLSVGGATYAASIVFPGQMDTFVHEFAHSIHHAIYDLEPNIEDRFIKAYEQAIALGTWKDRYAETNLLEYWAEGVWMWHYHIGTGREFETKAAFAARDPLLAALLSEWFHEASFYGVFGTPRPR